MTSLEEQRHYQSSYLEDILDMNISEDSIRKHYHEWCAKFHRKQDSFRFIVFQRNYLSQFKWNLAAGKQAFTLNEYADCTEGMLLYLWSVVEGYGSSMKRRNSNLTLWLFLYSLLSEEYKLLMERAAEKAKYTTTPVALEEQALEVTVVFDENDIPHVDFQTPNNYIDAEVVEKEPHWLA